MSGIDQYGKELNRMYIAIRFGGDTTTEAANKVAKAAEAERKHIEPSLLVELYPAWVESERTSK